MIFQKPRLLLKICFLLLTLALLIGCGGKGSAGGYDSYDERTTANTGNEIYDVQFAGTGFDPSGPPGIEPNQEAIQIESTAPLVARKLIKQASLRIEADPSFVDSEGNLSGINQKIDELVKKYGAYVENSKSDEDTARFTIRVPEVFYESMITGISVLGKTLSRTETAEDVTVKYYDLEGRLNTKKTLLATFQGYLSRTTSIDDIMKVEARISELQNEIDWLGNQLTRLGNLVDYATVELTIFTNNYIPPASRSLGDRIKQLFGGFGDFASNVLVGILWIIMYLVPILLLCIAAYWLLFGKVGILKKLFRSSMPADKPQKKDDKQKNNNSQVGEQ